jgi:hypothetical protein
MWLPEWQVTAGHPTKLLNWETLRVSHGNFAPCRWKKSKNENKISFYIFLPKNRKID